MRSLPVIIVSLSACAVLCGPVQSSTAAPTAAPTAALATALTTDVDLIMQTASTVVESGMATLDASRNSLDWNPPLLIVSQQKHEANWIVEHLLVDQMLSRGMTVELDSTRASATATRLSYRIVDLDIRGESGLFGGSVSRDCRVTVALRLSRQSDGAVLWQHESSGHRGDRVPKTLLDALSNDDYKFADTRLEQRSWGKVAEPAIVSGVLGSLVYFFFSNR